MTDALHRALAAGATIVTPNRRLARHLVDAFDRANRDAGARAWPSARVLPWPAFVLDLEREATAALALEPRVRLTDLAATEVWREALDADGASTLDPSELARTALEAWELVNAYGDGGDAWRAFEGGSDERAAFARWAKRYRNTLEVRRATDAATAPDRLASADPTRARWQGRAFVFAGFLETTPQQRRVAEVLRRAGATVEEFETVDDAVATPLRPSYPTADAELGAALAWARHFVESRPGSRVGIVVPDLDGRRANVRQHAIDVLGLPDDAETEAPAWNLSLGPPIAEVPLVAAALRLIALAWIGLPAGPAAALLRSAHLPGGTTRWSDGRAGFERAWLERNVDHVRAAEAIGALGRAGDPLAARLAEVHAIAGRTTRSSRRGWVDAWRAALSAAGWPGDRPLSSAEHQAFRALDEHFAAYAALDGVAPRERSAMLSAESALAAFAEIAEGAPFQPELPEAPIQVLGLFEAVGLPFDALWVSGMSDEALPRAPRLHPFLPVAWQRERGVPRTDPARELAFADAVASWLLRAAPEVVVSHATSAGDRPAMPSVVFPKGRECDFAVPVSPAEAQFAVRPPPERVVDASAPPLSAGERTRGGSGLIAAQSDCPFQALAAKRWRADAWPESAIGLTAMERGTLAHAALAAFWRGVQDHASLVELRNDATQFAEARRRAVEVAIAALDARWRRLPAVVRGLEAERIDRLLDTWLATEAGRPPFEVAGVECDATLALGPLDLALRLDRVDRLADGGVAILDYKTGNVPPVRRWTDDRPEATQMALYTLAWRRAHPEDAVRAAVLAQLKRGSVGPVGLYADAAARIEPPSGRDDHVVDWPALEARWEALMGDLAASFARGDAAVAPRRPALCTYCRRQPLCRIDAAAERDVDGEAA